MIFVAGQIVRLKSGGPDMTVTQVFGKTEKHEGFVHCTWFEGKKRQVAAFTLPTIELVLPPAAPSHHEPEHERT